MFFFAAIIFVTSTGLVYNFLTKLLCNGRDKNKKCNFLPSEVNWWMKMYFFHKRKVRSAIVAKGMEVLYVDLIAWLKHTRTCHFHKLLSSGTTCSILHFLAHGRWWYVHIFTVAIVKLHKGWEEHIFYRIGLQTCTQRSWISYRISCKLKRLQKKKR